MECHKLALGGRKPHRPKGFHRRNIRPVFPVQKSSAHSYPSQNLLWYALDSWYGLKFTSQMKDLVLHQILPLLVF